MGYDMTWGLMEGVKQARELESDSGGELLA